MSWQTCPRGREEAPAQRNGVKRCVHSTREGKKSRSQRTRRTTRTTDAWLEREETSKSMERDRERQRETERERERETHRNTWERRIQIFMYFVPAIR